MQAAALTSGGTATQYDPVLYIGTDGKLYGEWWNGTATSPAVSASAVDDGLWHHAVLTAYASSETLYLDGPAQQNISGSTSLNFSPTHLTLGAGYIGGNWPNEPHYQQSGSTGYPDYFTGQIADAIYSYPGGP